MRNFITSCLLVFGFTAHSAIHIVTVANFSFSPANFSAVVGDIVRFTWSNGSHTTTSATIPGGATSWDSPMNSATTEFNYTITAAGTYNYDCLIHGGMSGSFTASSVLPVKLIDFTVKSLDQNSILVSWKTLTEGNSDYFSIERSENGRNFKEVGKVMAAGSSISPLTYNYTDNTANPQLRYLYYRLNTVDKDGKLAFSPIVLLKQNNESEKIILSIGPNPVKVGDHIKLWFNGDAPGKLSTQIYDAGGRLVYNTLMNAFTGVNFGHIHIKGMPAGSYMFKLSLDRRKESFQIIVVE